MTPTNGKTLADLSNLDLSSFAAIVDGIIMFVRELINQLQAVLKSVKITGRLYPEEDADAE